MSVFNLIIIVLRWADYVILSVIYFLLRPLFSYRQASSYMAVLEQKLNVLQEELRK